MLPDFVKVREPINDALSMLLRRLVNMRPILASIRSERFFEGHMWGGSSEEVQEGTHGFRRFEAPSIVPTEELIARGPEALIDRLPDLAKAMADQLERRMLDRIKEAANENGGVHAGSVHPGMSLDDYLAELDKLEIDFDRDGNAVMPMVIASPEMLGTFKQWDADPEAKAKLDVFLQRKREAFDAREGHRALVD